MITVSPTTESKHSRYKPTQGWQWYDYPYTHRHGINTYRAIFADGDDEEEVPDESPVYDPGGPPVHTD